MINLFENYNQETQELHHSTCWLQSFYDCN